jgi:rhamnulose-1-phosphate aldolase/alcohol dehydrogenase
VTHPDPVGELLARSNRLGADRSVTNHGGGNTSAKASGTDPVTGEPVALMWVKGSGGDLGTLTADGLAVLRLDRLRALVGVYPGADREDEMVELFDHCRFGHGGAAPSIDTAMHGLLDSAHVDHLHPDAGVAFATAADGERLTRRCFGDEVVWVPWRRPGFQLGLDIAAVQAAHPRAVGVVLGGHGITAWGATSAQCLANSRGIIDRAAAYIGEHGADEPFGRLCGGQEPLPAAERRARAARLAPLLRARAATDGRVVGHFTDTAPVLDFLARSQLPRLARLGTSCPDHFLRTRVRPLVLDLPTTAAPDAVLARLDELHEEYRADYTGYYRRHATAGSPAMRGASPTVVLVPGVGMFSFGATKQDARLAGEFYAHAINAMRGAEALSTYRPIEESEKFRIEYWSLEEAKLARRPAPRALAGRVALVTGGGGRLGRATATRLAGAGACVVVADLDGARAAAVADGLGSAPGSGPGSGDAAVAMAADLTQDGAAAALLNRCAVEFGGVDVVVHAAGPARCAAVSREAARVMIEQGTGGDIVHITDGPAEADPDRRIPSPGIRVNDVVADPTARPEHVAAAVLALTGGELSMTTGAVLPVGGTVAR